MFPSLTETKCKSQSNVAAVFIPTVPNWYVLENLWKKGVIFFDVNLLNFLLKKIMLVSVKIYRKKRGTIAKKGPNTYTTSWKVIAQVVLVSMNRVIYFLAPRVGYFAHMDLKQKWNVLEINAN